MEDPWSASTRPDAPALPFEGASLVERASTDDFLGRFGGIGSELTWAWAKDLRPVGLAARPALVFAAVASVIEHGVDLDLDVAAGLIGSYLASQFDTVEQHEARTLAEIGRFFRYVKAQGAGGLDEITPAMAEGFIGLAVRTPGGAWLPPQPKTQQTRRGAIKVLYAAARRLELHRGDPTLDIELPPTAGARVRPLTDEEEGLGRLWSQRSLVNGRHVVAWALHQAGGTLSEAAHVTIDEVDLDGGRVWFAANNKHRVERWAPLTEWGVARISERITELAGSPGTEKLLTTARASKNARTASTGALIGQVFQWAGLAEDRSIEPRSLPAWAGRRVFNRTGRIEDAARFLGVRNLQTAAELIDYDW